MAILLVGNGETEDQRKAFEKDINDMERLITDPRVMGIRSVSACIYADTLCL